MIHATVPDSVDGVSYTRYRARYEALPPFASGRGDFRQKLLQHLLEGAAVQLDGNDPLAADVSFRAALSLYDGSEIFQGQIRDQRLTTLARRLEKSFRQRGDEKRVLLALCVQMAVRPEDQQLRQRYAEIVKWLRQMDNLMHGQSRTWLHHARALESVVRVWPSPFVVDELRKLYVEQKTAVTGSVHGLAPRFRHLRGAVSALFQTGLKTARLYLLVGRPDLALERLREIATDGSGADRKLEQLLDRATATNFSAEDLLRLAEHFEARDRAVGLRICRDARWRFPQDARLHGCVGRIAASLKKVALATSALRRAVELDATNRTYAELLAQQYQRRMLDLISDEKLDQAEQELQHVESFYRAATRRFSKPLQPNLASVHYAIGHGMYNMGRLGKAARAFRKSLEGRRSPDALVQLAAIALKKGETDDARRYLRLARRAPMPSRRVRVYWSGRADSMLGDILLLEGRGQEAAAAHRRSLASWSQLRSLGIATAEQAEAGVHEARSHFALGQVGAALDALDAAVDVDPERTETYADAVALLTTRGHLPEAIELHHRLLSLADISEYLKTYCSFWVINLARRAGQPPDERAMEHLKSIESKTWYSHLARFFLGEVDYETLLAKAQTKADRAELYYYQGEALLAAGKVEAARALWQKVLDTDMLGFYEYDMAGHNLRFGPARVHLDRVQRHATAAEPPRTSDRRSVR